MHMHVHVCAMCICSRLHLCCSIHWFKYLLKYYNLNLTQNLPRTYILQFDLSDISVTLKRDQGHQNWQERKVIKSYD